MSNCIVGPILEVDGGEVSIQGSLLITVNDFILFFFFESKLFVPVLSVGFVQSNFEKKNEWGFCLFVFLRLAFTDLA